MKMLLGEISLFSRNQTIESTQRVEQIDPACCGVAVGSSSPGCAAAAKGTGVHRLKGHVSWVQNGVSQFGLYLREVLLSEGKEG